MYHAKLISITQPCPEMMAETGAKCAEDLISFCARVSNPKNQEKFDTAHALLAYCMREDHWSVFEMADMTLEIKCTRDIGRQILRHRAFSFQEFSQRYAAVSPKPTWRDLRFQDKQNRQNSIIPDLTNPEHAKLDKEWQAAQERVWEVAREAYEWALAEGVAKEQARAVLPEGLTPSTMYMKGSVRNWIHYCQVRLGNGTQQEHRWLAEFAWEILEENFEFLRGLGAAPHK